jgi:hypothetical protein
VRDTARKDKLRFRLPHLTAADAQVLDDLCRDALISASVEDEPPALDSKG